MNKLDYGDYVKPKQGQPKVYTVLMYHEEDGVLRARGIDFIEVLANTADILDEDGTIWTGVNADLLEKCQKPLESTLEPLTRSTKDTKIF